MARLARTTGLEATSHGFNVTGWSRHAPTPPATGLGIVLDTYNTFYYGKKGGTGRGGGEGRGKGEDRRAGYMNAAGDGLKPTHPVRRSEIDPGSGLPNEERPLAFSSPLSSPVTTAHDSLSISVRLLAAPSLSLRTPVRLFRLRHLVDTLHNTFLYATDPDVVPTCISSTKSSSENRYICPPDYARS